MLHVMMMMKIMMMMTTMMWCGDLVVLADSLVGYICDYVACLSCLRPYHVENTGSRPITEVKQRRARLVLGWVTAWEYRVL